MTFEEKLVVQYAIMALEYYARTFPGRILAAAVKGESSAPNLAKQAADELERHPIFPLVAFFLPRYMHVVEKHAARLVPEVVAVLKERRGELQKVATKYPGWLQKAILEFLNEVKTRCLSVSG